LLVALALDDYFNPLHHPWLRLCLCRAVIFAGGGALIGIV